MIRKITVNGKSEDLPGKTTISEFLEFKKIKPEGVTVELNELIIPRQDFDIKILNESDILEMVYYIGGGSDDNNAAIKSGLNCAVNIIDLIHNTPIIALDGESKGNSARIFAKLEYFNPGGSVKDRIALNMIEAAEAEGELKSDTVVIEPTSGNTGIGLAMICAVKKYRCILVMPEGMSAERISMLKNYGAEVVFTSAQEGMQGSINKASELKDEYKNAIILQQFTNLHNPEIHRSTTAQEILKSVDGTIDAFVCGIGTGGTITGVGEVLKEKFPAIQIVGVEPAASAVLSGGACGPHMLQGIGAGFVPEILNRKLIERIISVSDDQAYKTVLQVTKSSGLFCGISSGAALYAAIMVAKELGSGKQIVTIFPDNGEKYMSLQPYFEM